MAPLLQGERVRKREREREREREKLVREKEHSIQLSKPY